MSQHAYGLKKTVLIETSWNVKTHLRKFKDDIRHRINRNIVECKDVIVIPSTEGEIKY